MSPFLLLRKTDLFLFSIWFSHFVLLNIYQGIFIKLTPGSECLLLEVTVDSATDLGCQGLMSGETRINREHRMPEYLNQTTKEVSVTPGVTDSCDLP